MSIARALFDGRVINYMHPAKAQIWLTTRSTCQGEIFKSGISGKIEGSIPLFSEVLEFPYNPV